MTKRTMTNQEIAQSSALRYRSGFGWFTIEELRVLQHALNTYIALGPDNSWPIKLARDLRKGTDL